MFRRMLLSVFACVIAAAAQPPVHSETSVALQHNGVTGQTARLILFSVPGATETYPTSINDDGVIAGWYADANGGHGFLRGLSGGFVTFSAPGSPDIFPSSINAGGAVAGNYGAPQYGFLRAPDGDWTTFNVPGTFPSSSGNPIVINDSGLIAGPYFDGSRTHGFLRALNGSFLTIDAPASTSTDATGLNAGGTVTGTYDDASYTPHGFIRAIDGTWTSFDVPGNNFGFFPPTLSINDSGVVVGQYLLVSTTYGFLWQAGGALVTFNVPGAQGTLPSGINSGGAVAGSYYDTSSVYQGFLRIPSGTVYTFSVPGATGTYVTGINDSGMIAGSYQDDTNTNHGFLLIP